LVGLLKQDRPASAHIGKPPLRINRVSLAGGRPVLVYPDQQTVLLFVGRVSKVLEADNATASSELSCDASHPQISLRQVKTRILAN
jgi:hypothetical protein